MPEGNSLLNALHPGTVFVAWIPYTLREDGGERHSWKSEKTFVIAPQNVDSGRLESTGSQRYYTERCVFSYGHPSSALPTQDSSGTQRFFTQKSSSLRRQCFTHTGRREEENVPARLGRITVGTRGRFLQLLTTLSVGICQLPTLLYRGMG